MIPKLKPYFLYLGIFSLMVVSIMSIAWTQCENCLEPPIWALILSFFSFFIGILLTLRITADIIKSSGIGKQVKKGFFAFHEFLKYVPEVGSVVNELKLNVQRKEIIPGSPHFESILSEMRNEFKIFLNVYSARKLVEFRKKFLYRGAIGVILIFACLYISNYSIEMYFNHQPGFTTDFLPGGNLFGFLMESFYYSVTTFTTLGYGDIRPNASIVAMVISSVEVLFFVLFFSFSISFGLHQISKELTLDPEDMTDILRAELEAAGEGVRI
jgi:hypothetical protein